MNRRHPLSVLFVAVLGLAGCSSSGSDTSTATSTTTGSSGASSSSSSSSASVGVPTSLMPQAMSCASVAVETGKTVISDDVIKIGSICKTDGSGKANGISKGPTCMDGRELYNAVEFWWYGGQPVVAGRIPNEVANECAYGPTTTKA